MSTETKTLRQPETQTSFGQIEPLEWFRCRFDDKPGVAMIICGKEMISNGHGVLFIGKDGDPRYLTVNTLKMYGGAFLSYLTSDEHVTIHGSLDPNLIQVVEDQTTFLPSPPARTDILGDVEYGIPFIYEFRGIKRYGIKYPAKNGKSYFILQIHCDVRNMAHYTTQEYDQPGRRRFINYDLSLLHLFENHRYKYLCKDMP